MRIFRWELARTLVSVIALWCLIPTLHLDAQNKGEPGKFDFYLLNLSWSPEFCGIQGTSPQCKARRGFIVHGLWPQNNDGSYPVFCAEQPGPAHPEENLDITPDLSLLAHEWAKHGTCTLLSAAEFFGLERKAYHSLAIPSEFAGLDREISMKPEIIIDLFQSANPSFPKGSILVSCENHRLTAVEACLAKDGLQPIACRGLHECSEQTVTVRSPRTF